MCHIYDTGIWRHDPRKVNSFMHHVSNKHKDHDIPIFRECAEGELQPHAWIKVGMHGILSNTILKSFSRTWSRGKSFCFCLRELSLVCSRELSEERDLFLQPKSRKQHAYSLCFEARPSAKTFIWQLKFPSHVCFREHQTILIRNVSHQASLWNRNHKHLGNGLLSLW